MVAHTTLLEISCNSLFMLVYCSNDSHAYYFYTALLLRDDEDSGISEDEQIEAQVSIGFRTDSILHKYMSNGNIA